jgi:hypothetical protein
VVVGLLTITDRWTFGESSCTASYLKLPIQDRLGWHDVRKRKEHKDHVTIAWLKWRRFKLTETAEQGNFKETSLLFTCARGD